MRSWRFVSERIDPVDFAPGRGATGGPCLPTGFVWRGEERRVVDCQRTWTTDGAERGGGDERYVRRHWFEVRLGDGTLARLYFLRQPQGAGGRWFLHAVV